MKKKQFLLLPLAALALSSSLVTSCSKDLADDEHYQTPDWLKGNAYEVLQKEGNYSIFLRGIDLVDTAGIVNGKSLVTVAAPNDDAFKAFLTDKGYSSIDEMYQAKPQYVCNLINMHLMYYGFDWSKLVNFRPSDGDGATEAQKEANAGCYYKHRTHGKDPIETVMYNGNAIKVYHQDKLLPVFSTKLFETKAKNDEVASLDAAYNYNYFYPNTTWWSNAHSGDGFNIANALVSDDDNVITDNGYLYHVDKVIEPLNTIYDELKNDPDYSKFLNIYDTRMTYSLVADEIRDNLGYEAYVRTHGTLAPIALEWPDGATYKNMDKLEYESYNLFAPTNTAMDNFFNSFWSAELGYASFEELDPLIREYFINQTFSADRFIAFPEEIKLGKVKTYYGTDVNFNPDEIAQNRRKVCVNGFLYGMDKMQAPAIFSSVIGTAFRNKLYRCYLYSLDASKLVSSLASTANSYVELMPDTLQFENAQPSMRLLSSASGSSNGLMQVYSDDAQDWTDLSSKQMTSFVNIHTSDNVSSLPTDANEFQDLKVKVIPTYEAFNYWYVKPGRKITTSALYNNYLTPGYSDSPYCQFEELKTADGQGWSNGRAYKYTANSIFKTQSQTQSDESIDALLKQIGTNKDDNRYAYYYFAQLLKAAGLITSNAVNVVSEGRLLIFAPTNEFIKEHLTSIPGCANATFNANGTIVTTKIDKTALTNYLYSCFISQDKNTISDYPYVGSSCKGEFINEALGKTEIVEQDGALYLRAVADNGTKGQLVKVNDKYDYLPFAFTDACLQFVDGVVQ